MNSTETQEQLNAYKHKKQALRTKAWFRIVQVIYGLAIILAEGFVILLTYNVNSDQQGSIFVWGTIIIIAVFWAIKRIGYYIMIGNADLVRPEYEDTLDYKLNKKHHE